MAVGQRDRVLRAVQRHPRVVAHAAVDGDEGAAARLRLTPTHPVHRDTGPRADGAAGFDHDGRAREVLGGARLVQRVLDDGGQLVEAELRVTGGRTEPRGRRRC